MSDKPATKNDVEEIVGRVVGDATNKILTAIGDQLQVMNDDVDGRFDGVDARLNRIENKLDSTVDKVDDHAVRISKLENQQA